MAGIYVVVSDTRKAGMRRGRGTGFDMGDMLSAKDFRMARFKPEKHSVMVRDATLYFNSEIGSSDNCRFLRLWSTPQNNWAFLYLLSATPKNMLRSIAAFSLKDMAF